MFVPKEAPIAPDLYLGLVSMQYRGEVSAGIGVGNNQDIFITPGAGEVRDIFGEESLRAFPEGIVGHAVVSQLAFIKDVDGQPHPDNSPIFRGKDDYVFSLGVNGNFTQAAQVADKYGLEHDPAQPGSVLVADLIETLAAGNGNIGAAAKEAFSLFAGDAFSATLITPDSLMYVRDPHGFRPLWEGAYNWGKMVATEMPILRMLEATLFREVERGTFTTVSKDAQIIESIFPEAPAAMCAVEFTSMSRPDNEISGLSAYRARYRIGQELARHYPVAADIVSGIPESGLIAALGYSNESGIPFVHHLLVKSRNTGRTHKRRGTNLPLPPLNPITDSVVGKSVLLTDDSIIEGKTAKHAVASLRHAGAAQVHLLLGLPPHSWPCFAGRQSTDVDGFLSREMTIEQMARHLGLDSLGFLPEDALRTSLGHEIGKQICTACFTGEYKGAAPEVLPPPEHGDGSLYFSNR